MIVFFNPESVCYFFVFPELIRSKSTLANIGAFPSNCYFAVLLKRSRELFSFFLCGRCLKDEELLLLDPLAPVVFEFFSVVTAPVTWVAVRLL